MSEEFPKKLKLGKYEKAANMSKLNKPLKKSRLMVVLLVEDSEERRGVHVFIHGQQRSPNDIVNIVRTLEKKFNVIIPYVLVPSERIPEVIGGYMS